MELYKSGHCNEAILLEEEALNTQKEISGTNDSNYITLLDNLSILYSSIGNYQEAINRKMQALKIVEEMGGKGGEVHTLFLKDLAEYNYSLGNYNESIQLGKRAINNYEKMEAKEYYNYAYLLDNIGLCYAYLGNYQESIHYGTEALKTIEKLNGKENTDYIYLLCNLSDYNYCLDNYDETFRIDTLAMKIGMKTLTNEDPVLARVLRNANKYNEQIEHYDECIRYENMALTIYEKVYGKISEGYISSLAALGRYYSMSGNKKESIRLMKETLNYSETLYGNKNHSMYIQKQMGLCISLYFACDYIAAYNNASKTTLQINKLITSSFSTLTSQERTFYWNNYSWWYINALPNIFYSSYANSKYGILYDAILLSKGLLLNADTEMRKLILESGNKEILAKYDELKSKRIIWEKQLQKPIAERILNTDSISAEIQKIEKELIAQSKVYGDYTRNLAINWQDVQKKLGNDDIAIEYLSFPVKNDSIIYTALVLRKEMDNPKMITLFEGKQLHAISPKEYYTSPKISQLVWKPLEEELRGVKQIYFAPAGDLHNIAIESLMDSDSTFISDRFNLYRLSSTRQLALNKDLNQVKDAKIYGGLEYDTDAKILIAQSREYKPTIRDFGYTSDINPDSLNLRSGAQDLPATKIEAEEIKQSFEKTHKVQAELFTGIKGTETSFKALSGKHPSFIHIATHGFYWNETEAKRQKNMLDIMMLNDNMKNRYVEDKALTRSGLLFSGANIKLRGDAKLPDGVDDGILTAKEIAGLDLRGTELVVLSACQTGLGEITGDGVFGLQRGFKKAGARTLLMSLWKVDDNATKLLMSQFYKNLIAGKSYFESLHNAQKYVRNYEIEIEVKPDDGQPKVILSAQNRTKLQKQNATQNKVYKKKKIYTDPYYWAAFILLDATD